jgi:hypothetical protein
MTLRSSEPVSRVHQRAHLIDVLRRRRLHVVQLGLEVPERRWLKHGTGRQTGVGEGLMAAGKIALEIIINDTKPITKVK